MLGLALTVIAALILAAIVLGYILPDRVHVERQTLIEAPADVVFGLVSDFRRWNAWSPWATLDPDATYEFSGEGVGQRMTWTSAKREVGAGAQEIVALKPPIRMVSKLDFGKMGKATAAFDIEPVGAASKVTWSMDARMRQGVPPLMQPMATYMGFFMDRMMDKPYTEGLANLKKVAEAR